MSNSKRKSKLSANLDFLVDMRLVSPNPVIAQYKNYEECYPKQLVIKSIKDEFGIEIKSEELVDTKAKTIKKFLLGREWNQIIGGNLYWEGELPP